MNQPRYVRQLVFLFASLVVVTIGWTSGASAATCDGNKIATADGCATSAKVRQKLAAIIKENQQTVQLQAVIARVDIGGRAVLRRGFGESQNGVPARPDMSFRIGSMTIPVLTTLIYQLREEGRLKLTDPIARWLPGMPRASQITVRQLMNNTSGYFDWIQGNEAFQNEMLANPFRIWSENELLRTALDRGFVCPPGTCFSYAHTNYLILARIARKIMPGKPLVSRLRSRVLKPLGIRLAFSRLAPIPSPALSSFTVDRGIFEESTGWSPSWGLGNGMLATTTIDEVAKIGSGVLSGATLKPWARKDMVKRYAPGLGPDPARVYFGQGLIVVNGWRRQNPFFNGYMGNVAWFPRKRIAVSLVGTSGPDTTAGDGVNVTDQILSDIAAYLTPSNPTGL